MAHSDDHYSCFDVGDIIAKSQCTPPVELGSHFIKTEPMLPSCGTSSSYLSSSSSSTSLSYEMNYDGSLNNSSEKTDMYTLDTGESSIQSADSNSTKQTFVPCKVCGDRASGFHYGVTSCEGCKGFFRRSIQKQIEYRCLREGKCLVIRLNRNRCQYCRFKKCLAVGMSRDSVRYGRVPKKAKQEELEKMECSGSSVLDQQAMENKRLAMYDIILNISQAHHTNCLLTEDKLKDIKRVPTHLVQLDSSGSPVTITSNNLESQRLCMWEKMAEIITPSIQSIVEFSKRVPGFAELNQDDQLILIKSGFFEIWLIRLSRTVDLSESLITFEDGSVIHHDELGVLYSPSFVMSVFTIAAGFNQLNLNDTEIGLFAAVTLATPDRGGLTDTKAIEVIQDQLIEALKLQITRNHSTDESLFTSTLMKLPELRTLSSQHSHLLPWLRTRWNMIRLPPLFSEIYDIPKAEANFDNSASVDISQGS